MDDEGIELGHEGVLWVKSGLPVRTIYTDEDGADYDVTHIRLRYEVIEAAKAFIADAPDDILVPWHDLRRAVEALQEVEGE